MKNSSRHIQTGKIGEEQGFDYLQKIGYTILEKNYRTYVGEIDCIALHKGVLVFIEIKTRRGNSFGFPSEAVVRSKQRKIIQSSQVFIQQKSYNLSESVPVRYDVLGIILSELGETQFELIQDAFQLA